MLIVSAFLSCGETTGMQNLPLTLGERVVQRIHTGVCKMKNATYPQIKDVAVRFLNLSTDGIDGEAIQKGLEGSSIDDVDRRLKAFLNNGLNFVMKGLNVLTIDRAKPFDPAKFIGSDWTIWRGPKNGSGLEGEEEQDTRSLKLAEVDFAKVLFTACLKDGESVITGEEKLVRHIVAKHIRLDAKVGQTLFEEKDQATLNWLYATFKIGWFEFPGTVLRFSSGHRCFLGLYRVGSGQWSWRCHWLVLARDASSPSAVLAS